MFLPEDLNLELDEEIDTIKFWIDNKFKFPSLSLVYKKVISCSASSAPSERVFSTAGLRMTPRRSRSSHDTISKLVYLNINDDML